MKEIEVIIDENGQASIDLMGWEGKGCGEIAQKLAKSLGITVKTTKKADYWKTEAKTKQKIIRGM